MDEAFLELLEKKEFAYITVKEICEKAGVNRSTFYLHYDTIADLLAESTQYLYSQFLKYIEPNSASIVTRLGDCPLDALYLVTPEYLTPYLNYIKAHKRQFRTAVENSVVLEMEKTYEQLFRHVFTPILERYQVPVQDRTYIMDFYIHGLMAIINAWLKNDYVDSIDHVISVIQRCMMQPHKDKGHAANVVI